MLFSHHGHNLRAGHVEGDIVYRVDLALIAQTANRKVLGEMLDIQHQVFLLAHSAVPSGVGYKWQAT